MSEPSWHQVIVYSRERLEALPMSICCNCGGGRHDVAARRIQLYRNDPFRAATTHLHLAVPACPACAPTLRRRDPRIDGLAVQTIALIVGVAVVVFTLTHATAQIAAVAAACAALAVYLLRRWVRRPCRGARVTNYQPIRFLGNEGMMQDTYYLTFANPAYAALVSAHCEQPGPEQIAATEGAAALPSARVVPRRPRGDQD